MQSAYPEAQAPEESHHDTINQGELYNGMAVQIGDRHDIHSKNWYNEQEANSKEFDKQGEMMEAYVSQHPETQAPEESHHDTIDKGELYNGMAVQLSDRHDIHSKNWYNQQE